MTERKSYANYLIYKLSCKTNYNVINFFCETRRTLRHASGVAFVNSRFSGWNEISEIFTEINNYKTANWMY